MCPTSLLSPLTSSLLSLTAQSLGPLTGFPADPNCESLVLFSVLFPALFPLLTSLFSSSHLLYFCRSFNTTSNVSSARTALPPSSCVTFPSLTAGGTGYVGTLLPPLAVGAQRDGAHLLSLFQTQGLPQWLPHVEG